MKKLIASMALAVASASALAGDYKYSEQSVDNLADLAIVPYYTTRDSWSTGVHIKNTSDLTQVLKFRLRRGTDSADVLDFNIVMSPFDVWTGWINDDSGVVTISSRDTSCLVPNILANANGAKVIEVPEINRLNSEEGYIEVIAMGSADENQYISQNAIHVEGVPVDCDEVEENFFAKNVLDHETTVAKDSEGETRTSKYGNTKNVLSVNFFIKDADGGNEMGDNATHIKDFSPGAMMTNQQFGISSDDFAGFDFPDLNGGGDNGAPRNLFDKNVRRPLSVQTLANDWSFNEENGVTTAWVVTFPGQYLMRPSQFLDLPPGDVDPDVEPVNYTDLPVDVEVTVFDREEFTPIEEGGLVISPAQVEPNQLLFPYETNIVVWASETATVNTLESKNVTTIVPMMDSQVGWAYMAFQPNNSGVEQRIYDHTDPTGTSYKVAEYGIPALGFAAWNRTFNNPDKNYGRMVSHTKTSTRYYRPRD